MPRKNSVKPSSKGGGSGESNAKKRAQIHEFPSQATTKGPAQEPRPPYMKAKLQKPGLQRRWSLSPGTKALAIDRPASWKAKSRSLPAGTPVSAVLSRSFMRARRQTSPSSIYRKNRAMRSKRAMPFRTWQGVPAHSGRCHRP